MFTDQTNNIHNKSIFAGSPNLIKDLPEWLPKANFHRSSSDLIAKSSSNNEQITLVDYFSNFDLPSVLTSNGLLLNGSLLSTLAGPASIGKYAQAAETEVLSIGEVTSINGTVKAIRVDGNIFELSIGDPVFQGDTIETTGDGSVGLVFIDKTTFSLSEGGKMVLDELVYDPSTGNGSMTVDMLEGAFSFISGEVAKTGPDAMQLKTPVVTMGIRGTTVAGKAAVEGNDNSFTLLQDADGGVGQISVSNDGGTQVLSQVGATTVVSSFTVSPPQPVILTAAQIQANYGTALNVLPPTPAVAPQPQSAPPPQEEAQEEATQEEAEEDSDEDSEEEGNEDVSEEGDDESDNEETQSEEGLLEEEGTPEGEGEALDGEGPPEGEGGAPEGEEGGPALAPDGEALSSEQEIVGEEAFEQALADGATPEEAMAAAASAAGFDGPTPQGGPGDLGPGGPGDLGPGGPGDLGPGGPGGPGDLGPGGPGGPGDLGSGGNFSDPFSSSPGSPGNFVVPGGFSPSSLGGPAGGFNSSPFSGPLGFGVDSYGGPGGSIGPDPFGGLGGFSPDPFGGPVGGLDLLSGPQLAGYEDLSTIESFEPVFFFDDPSLYNDFLEPLLEEDLASSSNEGQTLTGDSGANVINGTDGDDTIDGGGGVDTLTGGNGDDIFVLSDFGDTITDFTTSDSLRINFTFDPPSSTYNVVRSDFYAFDQSASASSLIWNSQPSSSSQTITETESNGTFGSAQVINRSSFKIAANPEVGNDQNPWVNIESGYISNGVDIFRVDLQAGEKLTVDVDYGDSFSRSFDSYVTIYDSVYSSVAENDNSLVSQGGTGSSGTLDSFVEYTTATNQTHYIFVEDAPKNSNSNTTGDYELNISIDPTAKSTGLGVSTASNVGGNNELPYVINLLEDTSNYLTNNFKSGLVSSIKYTNSTSNTGSEIFLITGDGTNSAIWMWDDLSQGYGISNNELTFVAHLENFDHDNLSSSQISFTS